MAAALALSSQRVPAPPTASVVARASPCHRRHHGHQQGIWHPTHRRTCARIHSSTTPTGCRPTTGCARARAGALRSHSRSHSSSWASSSNTGSRTRTLRATPSRKRRKGSVCLCCGLSASTAHSYCLDLRRSSGRCARRRNDLTGASASQCGRGTIAPTVTSASNWPCSRSWSRGGVLVPWRRQRRHHPMVMGLVHIVAMGLVRIGHSRARRRRRCDRRRSLKCVLMMWTAAPWTRAAHPCRAPTSQHSPLFALPIPSRGPHARSRAARVRHPRLTPRTKWSSPAP